MKALPPLQTLEAFESAGRLLSMSLAGKELHVTHGAISRQIKTLETHLGLPLFRRMTRKIALTEAGASYFELVSRLLLELRRETESLQRQRHTRRLLVSSGVSFASKWLTPRLHRLMAHFPDDDVHLDVTDAPIDFLAGNIDVVLRYGNGRYENAVAERLMDETISPVCAPDYRARMGGIVEPEALMQCQLIHEIGMPSTWAHWFAMMGLRSSGLKGPGFSRGSMTIEAAIRGEGVALGRSVLVAEDVAAGRLVSLFPDAKLDVEWGYDLVYRVGHQNDPKVRAFRSWIADEVRTFLAAYF